MFGYIYLTENLVNHKKYIGKKVSSEFLGTKYLGSGTYLKRAIAKYGAENFRVKMLKQCYSSEELDISEVEFINEYDAVNSDEYYNLATGIKGNTRGSKKDEKWKARMAELATGRRHSEETCKKIAKIVSNTIWIYNPITHVQHKITLEELPQYEAEGYVRGRLPFTASHREALSKARLCRNKKLNKSSETIESNS